MIGVPQHFTERSEGVYTTTADVVIFDADSIDFLRRTCSKTTKKRARLCAHTSTDHSLHEMLIALNGKSYIQPHRHHNKSESFHVVEGLADIILFDDSGKIQHLIQMGSVESGRSFMYRIEPPVYHTLRIQSDTFIFHETTPGPFCKADSEYAPWAPDENNARAGLAWLDEQLTLITEQHDTSFNLTERISCTHQKPGKRADD